MACIGKFHQMLERPHDIANILSHQSSSALSMAAGIVNKIYIYIYIYMLHKKTVLVKKRHFYVKKLLFYKLSGCKNTAFLQKYIFVKKQLFYVRKLLFLENIFL